MCAPMIAAIRSSKPEMSEPSYHLNALRNSIKKWTNSNRLTPKSRFYHLTRTPILPLRDCKRESSRGRMCSPPESAAKLTVSQPSYLCSFALTWSWRTWERYHRVFVSISPLVSFSLFSLPFLLFPFPSPPSLVYYPLDPYSCSLFSGHFRPPLSLHITGPRCEVPVASCFRWPIVRRVHTRSASSLSAQLSHHPLPIFNKSLPNQPTTRLNRSTLDQPLPPPRLLVIVVVVNHSLARSHNRQQQASATTPRLLTTRASRLQQSLWIKQSLQ